jgi:hypothetical protein
MNSVWCSSDDKRLRVTKKRVNNCHTCGYSINTALWKQWGKDKGVNFRVKNGSWRGIYIEIYTFMNLYQQRTTRRSA